MKALKHLPTTTFLSARLLSWGMSFLALGALLLSGCQQSGTPWSAPNASISIQGKVFGGNRPVSGSDVQLYAAGTEGVGSSAQALLAKPVATDSNGSFSITESFTCPSSNAKIYVSAQGGNPGLAAGTENGAISLMAVLGPCGDLAAHTQVTVNEVTTVGSVSPVAAYMSSPSKLGSTPGDPQFPVALTRITQLVDTGNGISPGVGPAPDGYAVPTSKLNALANVLAACVESTGGVAGDGSICGALFTLATPPNGNAPTDTASAAMHIAQNPATNVSQLFALTQPASAPFQPALTTAPHDWSMGLVASPRVPTIQPSAGTYAAGQTITLTSATSGAAIHYTLDGSAPTASSPVYSAPLLLSQTETVTALASVSGATSATVSAAYSVSPGQLVFSSQPVNTAIGVPFTPVVKIVDPSGNVLPNSAPVTLTLASNPGGATISGTTTVNTVKGIATFPGLSLTAAGTGYSITATSSSAAAVASAPFDITSPALFISVLNVPVGTVATGSISLPVAASHDVAVSLSSNLPNYVSVPASLTIAAGQSRVAFSYTGNSIGIATLTASAPGYVTFKRNLAGVPVAPVFQPAAGAYIAGQTIALASTTPGAVIHYTLDGSSPTSASPAYTAPLVLSTAQTLRALASSGGQNSSVSAGSYTVIPTHIVFGTQPASTVLGSLFPSTVQIVDPSGNVLNSTATVTLSLGTNTGNATLLGTLTASAVNGTATFKDLHVSAVGTNYTLSATSAGSTSAASAPFNVTAPAPTQNLSGPGYYVSNSGSDSNTGSSSSSPWKTLARLNAATMAPGSSAFLQCGSIFRETLNVKYSGKAGQPISYDAYGDCNGSNKPVINGSDVLGSWTLEMQGTVKTYYTPEVTPINRAFEDGTLILSAATKTGLPTGHYWYDAANHRIYVRTREDVDPTSTHVIEAATRANGIAGYAVSYLNLSNLDVEKSAMNNISMTGSLTNHVLEGITSNDAYSADFYYQCNGGQYQNNILIDKFEANRGGLYGVYKGQGGNNFVVQNGVANYDSWDSTQTDYSSAIHFVSDGTNDAFRVTNSAIRNVKADHAGYNPATNLVTATSERGTGIWCDTCGVGTVVEHNIVSNSAHNGIETEFSGVKGGVTTQFNVAYGNKSFGILGTRRTHNSVWRNNTSSGNFINCALVGEYGGGETAVGMVNNLWENNICGSQVIGGAGKVFVAEWGGENNSKGEGSGNVYRNNSFGAPNATNGVFALFGADQTKTSYAALDAAYGSSMASMTADPMFNNPAAGDFSLKAGSPAIGAGTGGVDLGAIPYASR